MQVTVFDADYAGGSISWVGKTWTQQEVKDGVTKCACPDLYVNTVSGTVSAYFRFHTWGYNTNGTDSLRLRRIGQIFGGGAFGDMENGVRGKNASFRDRRAGQPATFPQTFQNINTPTSFTPIDAVGPITYGDYGITDAYSTSVTVSGITYSWDKGVGWP